MSLTPSYNDKTSSTASVQERLQQQQALGYTPFEYWKGPKPVLPTAKQSRSRTRPTIAVTALSYSGDHTAQQQIVAPAFPNEKNIPYWDTRYLSMGYGDSRYGGRPAGPASFQVRDINGNVELIAGQSSSYDDQELPPRPRGNMSNQSRFNPRYWRKRTWAGLILFLIVAIVAGVVAGVLVSKANAYPDYTKLSYSLQDTFSGTSFFDNFDYFEGFDPAQGFVHYVPKERATQLNLTSASSTSAVLKVDTSVGNTSTPDASTGRFSVRVTSKKTYDNGLFIFDIKHTPYGCGTWPALWLVDESNWPMNGEIDVMEAVNQATDGNQMTLHTNSGCEMDVKRKMTGSVTQTDCTNSTNSNAGCGVMGSTSSYGTGFNEAGGGIMAMEWRSEGIRMWQFGRNSIPSDITSRTPDPSTWGTAAADFPNTDCSVSSHFKNQSIVANIDLCGAFAGGVYATSGCPSNCTDYVANNPQAFTNAYWEFGSFQVFKAS